MNIGITIQTTSGSLWTNGINQNAIYLAMLIKKIGYTPYLIYGGELTEKVINELNIDIKTISVKTSFSIKFNAILQVGFTVSNSILNVWKQQNNEIKFVMYECGNNFLVDMESILFDAYEDRVKSHELGKNDPTAIPDQIWVIPQMEKICLQYYSFTLGQEKATVVPFIWNPIAIETKSKEYELGIYQPKELRRVGIMEPNLSVMKNILLPMAISEKYYTKYLDLDAVLMIGAEKLKNNKRLLQLISNMRLYKDNKITADGRINTPLALKKYIDVVLSWQWENNLNYLYLDVAWMGYPIIHNANLCTDIGYYYEDFNINMGVEQLYKVINTHNNDTNYLKRNRLLIERYTENNPTILNDYKKLFNNLFNDNYTKYKYNPINNSII